MRRFIALLFVSFISTTLSAQKYNVKIGLWSDATVWNGNTLPLASDDVVLNYDVTVNLSTSCNSLITNGHKVTVNAGVNFMILGVDDEKTLYQLIGIDSKFEAPYDTSIVRTYYYDSLKRPIGFDEINYEDGSPSDSLTEQVRFFYNGNDTLPYKTTDDMPFLTPTGDYTDYYNHRTSFYYYNNGKIVKDSSLGYNGFYIAVLNYHYSGDTIFNKAVYYDEEQTPSYAKEDTVLVTYNNGNIVHQETFNGYYYYVHDFTYDNHPNPFFKTFSNYINTYDASPYITAEAFVDVIFTKNNILTVDQVFGTTEYHRIITYEYKPNGYPKSAISRGELNEGEISKYIFIYKK